MKTKLLIIPFLFVQLILSQPRFEQLSLEEGVPLNLAYTMMHDSRGFIWFGTMHGLVKYDGRIYKVFRHNPDDPSSISFDDVVSLLKTPKEISG